MSVCPQGDTIGGTYPEWGYLPWIGVPTMDGGYLLWVEGTYLGLGIPTLDGGYLPWMEDTYLRQGVPTLDRGYYLRPGVPTLDGRYLPWRGRSTYLWDSLNRLFRVRYASCGFPHEDFLVHLSIS